MKVNNEQLGEVNLPDFLVVGAAKSGTSSLHAYLGEHPEITMPAIKEPWFFSFMDNPPDYTSPGTLNDLVYRLEDYSALFNGAGPGAVLGDASPSYLYTSKDTIKNIRTAYPATQADKLRIIICLREPVSRAHSQFMTMKRSFSEPLAFEEAIDARTVEQRLRDNWNIFYDYLGFGCYYEQVKAFIDVFGQERVMVILYDDISQDPLKICREIYRFIGVSPDYEPEVGVRHNSLSGEPRLGWLFAALISTNKLKRAIARLLPRRLRQGIKLLLGRALLRRDEMDAATRVRLQKWYLQDIERLSHLISRDLGHWTQDR